LARGRRANEEVWLEAHLDSEHFTRLVKEEAIPNLASRERAFYETLGDDRGGYG